MYINVYTRLARGCRTSVLGAYGPGLWENPSARSVRGLWRNWLLFVSLYPNLTKNMKGMQRLPHSEFLLAYHWFTELRGPHVKTLSAFWLGGDVDFPSKFFIREQRLCHA